MLKRLSLLWVAVKGDARRLWFALRHPQSPAWLKWGTALLLLYLVSPVDLVPDTLPVLGVLDDLVILPLVIRWMLRRLPPAVQAYAQARADGQPGDPPDPAP